MRPADGKAPAQAEKWEYFFQVGANAKDEISLQCGAFTMLAIYDKQNLVLEKMLKAKMWEQILH